RNRAAHSPPADRPNSRSRAICTGSPIFLTASGTRSLAMPTVAFFAPIAQGTAMTDKNQTRGDFLKQLAALFATTRLGPSTMAEWSSAARSAPPDNLVGIQMGPHTMLDEGIEHVLDLIQETASVDTIFTYCHSYGGDLRKPLAWLATDHGVPVIDQ